MRKKIEKYQVEIRRQYQESFKEKIRKRNFYANSQHNKAINKLNTIFHVFIKDDQRESESSFWTIQSMNRNLHINSF